MGDCLSALFAFPKTRRLLKTDDYSSVFSLRKVFRSAHFMLHYRPRSVADGECVQATRLGLVVAKRFLRRSVDRNLIRRLARETFRILSPQLTAKDAILRLSSRPASLNKKELAEEIRQLLGKISVKNCPRT